MFACSVFGVRSSILHDAQQARLACARRMSWGQARRGASAHARYRPRAEEVLALCALNHDNRLPARPAVPGACWSRAEAEGSRTMP